MESAVKAGLIEGAILVFLPDGRSFKPEDVDVEPLPDGSGPHKITLISTGELLWSSDLLRTDGSA